MLCHLPRAVLPSCPHDLNPFYACEITPTLGSFSEGLGLQTFSKSITNAWVVFKGEALRKICNTLSGRRQQFWQGHPMQCTSMSFLMFLVLVEALATVGSDKEWAKTSAKGTSPSTVWGISIAGHFWGKPWQTCGGWASIRLQFSSIKASRHLCINAGSSLHVS